MYNSPVTGDVEKSSNPGADGLVVPRGHIPGGKANLPIDQLLMPVLATVKAGMVLLTAPPGGGKSVAIEYLRRVLSDRSVKLFDSDQFLHAGEILHSELVVYVACIKPPYVDLVAVFEISPWTLDDCLEYLVARHRMQCASVMERLKGDEFFELMDGSPQLLCMVMDAMAGDLTVNSCREALLNFVLRLIPKGSLFFRSEIKMGMGAPVSDEQSIWWRHWAVQAVYIAERIVDQICEGRIPDELANFDEPMALISEIAAAIGRRPSAAELLNEQLMRDTRSPVAFMAASILLAVDPDWRPSDGRGMNLAKAQLEGARWAGVDLSGALLMNAHFADADLSGAKLNIANADGADFARTNLEGAKLKQARFVGASLLGARLSNADASRADFSEANLESAIGVNANFFRATFTKADFAEAVFERAVFSEAEFAGTLMNGAAFEGANFCGAKFTQVDLSEAQWRGAKFSGAGLWGCNLEYLEVEDAEFERADLTGSVLTGSRMVGGRFRDAKLCNTGLADVHWEDADLRGANLKGASFHMGSSRSGLVGSTIPSEGSRTGFYTDDFSDQTFKRPEEIRKACLCGANLMDAKVERTDFYLVDLRRAVFSKSQGEHFARSGAILRNC